MSLEHHVLNAHLSFADRTSGSPWLLVLNVTLDELVLLIWFVGYQMVIEMEQFTVADHSIRARIGIYAPLRQILLS